MTINKKVLRLKNSRGFTLLEIMLALLLISIGIVSVIQLSRINLKGLVSADDKIESSIRTAEKMREIISLPSWPGKSWSETDETGFTYDVAVNEIMNDRTDSLPVRMEEVTVTARWMKGNSTRQFVLKTAKVSFRSDN